MVRCKIDGKWGCNLSKLGVCLTAHASESNIVSNQIEYVEILRDLSFAFWVRSIGTAEVEVWNWSSWVEYGGEERRRFLCCVCSDVLLTGIYAPGFQNNIGLFCSGGRRCLL